MRNWLKKARCDSRLTSAQMGEKLSISESYYSRIERGDRKKQLDLEMIQKLADVLQLPMEQIIREEMQRVARD